MRIDRVGGWCGLWRLAAALLVALVADQRPAMGAAAAPTTRPNYDWYIIDQHHQFNAPSCIPSSIEMVLKLEHREPVDFYELQKAWGNRTDGTFADFDGRSIGGLTFHKHFVFPRTIFFPINDLFKTIDAELDKGRFVIVSLAWVNHEYHMFVIVDRTPTGEYRAVTKWGGTLELIDTKARIRAMWGTDIMTYEPQKLLPGIAFWFDYRYPPTPGSRQWRMDDATHWREIYPNGQETTYVTVGRNSDGEDQGTIVRRQPDMGFEALIPPIERGRIMKFRMNPKDSWRNLGPIEVPPGAPTTQTATRE